MGLDTNKAGWSVHSLSSPRHTTNIKTIKVQQLGVMLDIGSTQLYFLPSIPTSKPNHLILSRFTTSWVFSAQNDSVQPSGLLPYTQLYVPGNSPTWQSIPNATFSSGYEAGFTATGIVGTESLTVGQLPPVRQNVGVMWYDQPVMVRPFLPKSQFPFPTTTLTPPSSQDPQQIQGILGLGLGSDGTSGSQ